MHVSNSTLLYVPGKENEKDKDKSPKKKDKNKKKEKEKDKEKGKGRIGDKTGVFDNVLAQFELDEDWVQEVVQWAEAALQWRVTICNTLYLIYVSLVTLSIPGSVQLRYVLSDTYFDF